MTARELEAARRAMTRYVKRGGQVWVRVFPDVPITKKPLEVRMGSGKGNVEYYIAKIKPGKVLFEMEGVTEADRARSVPPRCIEVVRRHPVRHPAGPLIMSAKELRQKSAADLQKELLDLRREQFNLRMARATGQAAKPDQFTKVRRNIARLKTVIGEQRRVGQQQKSK